MNNYHHANDGEAKAKPEVIKLGFDLHARQVTECWQLDGSTPKPGQKWDPWKLLDKVEEWVKAGFSLPRPSNSKIVAREPVSSIRRPARRVRAACREK